MGILNCWNWKNCGRYPGGANAEELGVCPATTFEEGDRFLNGRGAGRACIFVSGTLCGGKVQGSFVDKHRNCQSCDYYQVLRMVFGNEFSHAKFKNYYSSQENTKVKTPKSQKWVSGIKTGEDTARGAKRNYPMK